MRSSPGGTCLPDVRGTVHQPETMTTRPCALLSHSTVDVKSSALAGRIFLFARLSGGARPSVEQTSLSTTSPQKGPMSPTRARCNSRGLLRTVVWRGGALCRSTLFRVALRRSLGRRVRGSMLWADFRRPANGVYPQHHAAGHLGRFQPIPFAQVLAGH